jgi:hypothetical protein
VGEKNFHEMADEGKDNQVNMCGMSRLTRALMRNMLQSESEIRNLT